MALKRWRLIEARKKAKLSQDELADAFDTTRVTISHWENAVTEPYPHFKRKLEERFGTDIEILLEITDEPDEKVDENAEGAREETKTSEVLSANLSTDLTAVSSCVWQPPTPSIQTYIVSNPIRHFWQIAHT